MMSWQYGFLDELEKIAQERRRYMGDDLDPSLKARAIPAFEERDVVLNIQRHHAAGAGEHLDLRIKDPKKQIAYSWAIPKGQLPQAGKPLLAVRQPDHAATYMGYKGKLETKAGLGRVDEEYMGPAHVHRANAGRIDFELEGERYLLHRTDSNRNWLLRRR